LSLLSFLPPFPPSFFLSFSHSLSLSFLIPAARLLFSLSSPRRGGSNLATSPPASAPLELLAERLDRPERGHHVRIRLGRERRLDHRENNPHHDSEQADVEHRLAHGHYCLLLRVEDLLALGEVLGPELVVLVVSDAGADFGERESLPAEGAGAVSVRG